MLLLTVYASWSTLYWISLSSGTANSAAAVGVGALISEIKSTSVKSVSCPTALITGIF